MGKITMWQNFIKFLSQNVKSGYVKLPECILKIFEGPHPHTEISPPSHRSHLTMTYPLVMTFTVRHGKIHHFSER